MDALAKTKLELFLLEKRKGRASQHFEYLPCHEIKIEQRIRMDFSEIYDTECEAKVIRSIQGYEKDEIEEFIEDEVSAYVVQLNPNSSQYDTVLDNLEEDGMTSFDYQKDEQKAWRFVGFYSDYSPEEVLHKFAGVGEKCIKVDLMALFERS